MPYQLFCNRTKNFHVICHLSLSFIDSLIHLMYVCVCVVSEAWVAASGVSAGSSSVAAPAGSAAAGLPAAPHG